MALHDIQGVGREIFARHKPRRVFAATARLPFGFEAADTKPLALPQCVEAQAYVLANTVAEFVFDGAGNVRDVAVQKLAKWTFANKTNTC